MGLYSMDDKPKANFSDLPNELICKVAQKLPAGNCQRLAQANQRINATLLEEMQRRLLYCWMHGNIVEKQSDKQEDAIFLHNGSFIATSHEGGSIHILNLETGKLIKKLNTESFVWNSAISTDGSLIVTRHEDGYIRLWNPITGKLIREWNIGSIVRHLTISPHCNFIATWHEDGYIRLLNLETGKLIREWNTRSAVWKLAISSPYGRSIVTKHACGYIRIWHPETENADC